MIWYLAPCIPGLRRVTLSRSVIGMVVQIVVPPSLAATIASGKFPA